jgi:TonB family protein
MRLSSILLVVLLGLAPIPAAFSADAPSAQTADSPSARKVINKVAPAYPSMARTLKLAGTVRLEALVLANGTVKSLQVKGGNPVLAQAAQNAVSEWKWAKAEHESTEMVEIEFRP